MTDLTKDISIRNLHLRNFVNLNDEELALVLTWRNSEAVRNLTAYDPKVIYFAEHKAFVEGLRTRNDRFYFLLKERERNIGVVCLLAIDYLNRRCLWGDYANPSLINSGTGVLLEFSALHLAFDVLSLHCVRCETLENNGTARRLHDFFGFETEGILRDYVYSPADDHYQNVVIMSVTAEQWWARKGKIDQLIGILV